MKQLINFIRIWKRDGFRETWEQFQIRFYEQQTPERLIAQEIFGYCGSIGGIILAVIVLLSLKIWYYAPFLVFIGWIQYVQLKGKLKQRRSLKEIKEMYKEEE